MGFSAFGSAPGASTSSSSRRAFAAVSLKKLECPGSRSLSPDTQPPPTVSTSARIHASVRRARAAASVSPSRPRSSASSIADSHGVPSRRTKPPRRLSYDAIVSADNRSYSARSATESGAGETPCARAGGAASRQPASAAHTRRVGRSPMGAFSSAAGYFLTSSSTLGIAV